MTRHEFAHALNNLLVDSADLPISEIVEELEDAVLAAQELERFEATAQRS